MNRLSYWLAKSSIALERKHNCKNDYDMTLKSDEFWKPVVTTKQVLAGDDIITCVILDEEGDWEVLGEEDFEDDDLDVVSVEDILALDPTLALLPDMVPGQTCVRTRPEEAWTVES